MNTLSMLMYRDMTCSALRRSDFALPRLVVLNYCQGVSSTLEKTVSLNHKLAIYEGLCEPLQYYTAQCGAGVRWK